MQETVWLDLVIVGSLIALGYLGARITTRLHLPSVTGFLLVGIAAGPHGFGLLTAELMHTIAFAEPLALGVIVFLIGEQLTQKMLRRHDGSFWLASVLNIVLPGVLVALVLWWLVPDQPAVVWLLAIIAVSGAPATIMAIISELGAKSRACNLMLGASALDTVFTVVAYSVVAPFLMLSLNIHATVGDALLDTAAQVGGGLVVGVLGGLALARLLKRVFKDGELLALGLVTVLLVVASAEALGFSSLLAALTAGMVVATIEERRGDRERVFRSLRTVEYPVYIIFFTLAGAHLELAAVLAAGGLAIAYIAARSLGKFMAGFAGGLASRYAARQSAWIGLGMLPQAGVAVGLGLAAAQTFPEAGATVNAVVLAAIVFFEVVGPVLTKRAIACTLEPEPAEARETDAACASRTILMPASAALPPERLLNTIEAAGCDAGCRPTIVLAHIMPLDRGVATLAAEYDADLVAMGAPLRGPRTGPGLSPLRSTQHRVLDALDIPVLIVPMPGAHEGDAQ